MRAGGSFRLLVPALALPFIMACGSAAASRNAKGAPSGTASVTTSGGVAVSQGAPASKPAGGHTWAGGAAWAGLSKLGNYAYLATTTTTDGAKSATATVEARYHSPTDYELTIRQGKQQAAQLILASNGHRYLVHAGQQAPMDLGAGGSKSPFAALFDAYRMQAAGPWTGLFSGSQGTYSGPCSVLGRPGSAFHVGGATSAAVGAVTGLSEKVAGTTCLDARTKVPLKAEFHWSMAAGSQTMTYSDRFEVTAIGTVPEIPPPSGAKPFPGAPGS